MQHPQSALVDPDLRKGTIEKDIRGLPRVISGGVALTYTVKTKTERYAVRCFHKRSDTLEKRYDAISKKLKDLHSQYFVDFEFQRQGVWVNGIKHPVVKMAWASGMTFGQFLANHYENKSSLQDLNKALGKLSGYLKQQHMAHGDIQPGNIMVAEKGDSIQLQLIDYDGMFVDDLKSLGSAEVGHRNFQHQWREYSCWNANLDHFSFIALNLALRALEARSDLWDKTQSDADTILFKANDFANPDESTIFCELFQLPGLKEAAKKFATICKSPFDKIPTLEDFLAQRNIPQLFITDSTRIPTTPVQYLQNYPVLNAKDFNFCNRYIGDVVELIGQIIEVDENTIQSTEKPYIYLYFGPLRGNSVRIYICADVLAMLSQTQRPDSSWKGKWISVVGLIDPPYLNPKFNYGYLSITIKESTRIHVIPEDQAKFRLRGIALQASSSPSRGDNREFPKSIRGVSAPLTVTSPSSRVPVTSNQAIVQKMKGSQYVSPTQQVPTSPGPLIRKQPTNQGASAPLTVTSPSSRVPVTSNQAIPQTMKGSQPVSPIQQAPPSPGPSINKQPTKGEKSGCLWFVVVAVIVVLIVLITQILSRG